MTSTGNYFREVSERMGRALGSTDAGRSAAEIIFDDVAGYDRKYLFMYPDRELLPETQARLERVVAAVEGGQPVQYAVGSARFMGLDIAVTPDVLIPRPETEGLCDMIIRDYSDRSDLNVLDIGTGSGCIALSLARALPFADVSAIDVSEKALEIARQNSVRLKTRVDFFLSDILTARPPVRPLYDIIVSNPPYVCNEERKEMDRRVADYEPATALFVPDDDPLRFYRAIARYASAALRPEGSLYLEFNSRFPREMKELLEKEGFSEVNIIRDYKGNYRYAKANF